MGGARGSRASRHHCEADRSEVVLVKLKHPAQYTPAIVDAAIKRLDGVTGTLLDPFAGPGQHLPRLMAPGRKVIGYEIEKPWADFGAPLVQCVDSTHMPRAARSVQAIFTSPAYGNRFADHHNAMDASTRRSYTHDMRTMLDDPAYALDTNNGGLYLFGTAHYHALHHAVWSECTRVAEPGAIFLLNVSDFIRNGQRVRVQEWHLRMLKQLGWMRTWRKCIRTPRMRHGQNGAARVDGEMLYELVKR